MGPNHQGNLLDLILKKPAGFSGISLPAEWLSVWVAASQRQKPYPTEHDP
jgi:hypothetical protein